MIKVECLAHPSKYKTSIIVVDGEPWREMTTSLVIRSGLFASYTSLEAWKQTWSTWEKRQVKLKAYDKLSRKRYFAKELNAVLSRYGFSKEVIEPCLTKLEEEGYLNDVDGKEILIASGVRKKKGPLWIQHQLSKKGCVSEFDLETQYPKEKRESTIREFLIKNQKKGQKAIASLARKGFSFEEIITVWRLLAFSECEKLNHDDH